MIYLSYDDLVARGVVNNRTTLARWIRDHGFPAGHLLGPNTRRWTEESVAAWLAARPHGREAAGNVPVREGEAA